MKKKVFCELCKKPIVPERLEILPETKTCVKCSQTAHYSESDILGFQIDSLQQEDRINIEDYEIDT